MNSDGQPSLTDEGVAFSRALGSHEADARLRHLSGAAYLWGSRTPAPAVLSNRTGKDFVQDYASAVDESRLDRMIKFCGVALCEVIA